MLEVALKDYIFVVNYFDVTPLVGANLKNVKNTFKYFAELWQVSELPRDVETHLHSEASYFEYRREHMRVII
jgi:hypothetical protein